MNKIFLSFVFCFLSIAVASAQSATYHLPKTALKISVLVEKKSYTPGRLSEYANRFLKKNVEQETFDHYRIINQDIELYAIPDSSRIFEAKMENKLNITLSTARSAPCEPSATSGAICRQASLVPTLSPSTWLSTTTAIRSPQLSASRKTSTHILSS